MFVNLAKLRRKQSSATVKISFTTSGSALHAMRAFIPVGEPVRPLHGRMIGIFARRHLLFKETITITWPTSIKRTEPNRNKKKKTRKKSESKLLILTHGCMGTFSYRVVCGDNGTAGGGAATAQGTSER